MTLVSGSPKRYSTYSGIRMSAAFPTVMSLLKPRPFSRANWAKVSAMLPLWEMRAIGPGGGCQPRALTRPDALKSPAQFGPIMRPPLARSRPAISRSSALPAGPVSPKPAVMTTTPGTRRSAHSAMTPGTRSGRTSTTARSTASGTSRRDR